MKKILSVLLVLGFGILLVSGCQQSSSTSQTKALDNSTAGTYSQMGIQVVNDLNESISHWVSSGAVNVGVIGSSVRGSSVRAQTVTGPDGNGYYHIVESTTEGLATIEVDVYAKLVKNGDGKVTDAYVYGGFTASLSNASYSITFGNGSATPYHAQATWVNSQLTTITTSGPLSETVTAASGTTSHTIALAFTLTDFTIPIPASPGNTYPNGTITISITYDDVVQPTNIVITFNGTSTVNLEYGDYQTSITIPPIVIS
jgi:hypothetical protein